MAGLCSVDRAENNPGLETRVQQLPYILYLVLIEKGGTEQKQKISQNYHNAYVVRSDSNLRLSQSPLYVHAQHIQQEYFQE